MKYIKSFFNNLKIIMVPLIFIIINFLIIIAFSLIFNLKEKDKLMQINNMSMDELMATTEYQEKLAIYLDQNSLYITLLTFIIVIPFLFKIYKKIKPIKNEIVNNNSKLLIVLFFIIISCFLNIFLLYFSRTLDLNNIYTISTKISTNLIISIITTCLIGPIIEELIYRGIVYNKFLKFYSKTNSIIMTTLIFAFTHVGITALIYSFVIGLFLNIMYSKTNDLKFNIIVHSIINLVSLLFVNLLIDFNHFINVLLIFVFIISIIIIIKIMKKYSNMKL